MMTQQRMTRAERCRIGKHTPTPPSTDGTDGEIRRGVCRYCRRPIMRTQATRTWFLATMLA
jgi:hypothetical protein